MTSQDQCFANCGTPKMLSHDQNFEPQQDRKLTFYGRHQLATKISLSVAKWKHVVAKKCWENFSFAAKHKPKLLVATGLTAKYLQSM